MAFLLADPSRRQLPNAPSPILRPWGSSLSGHHDVTEVRLEQPLKANFPMVVRLSGSVTEVRPEQPSKADSPIVVRRSGSVMLSEVQPQKAPWPREVRPAGSVTEASEVQPQKAPSPR